MLCIKSHNLIHGSNAATKLKSFMQIFQALNLLPSFPRSFIAGGFWSAYLMPFMWFSLPILANAYFSLMTLTLWDLNSFTSNKSTSSKNELIQMFQSMFLNLKIGLRLAVIFTFFIGNSYFSKLLPFEALVNLLQLYQLVT